LAQAVLAQGSGLRELAAHIHRPVALQATHPAAMMSLLSAVHAGPVAPSSSPAGVPEIEYPSPLSALPDEPLPFVVKNTFVVSAHLEPSSLLGSSAFVPRAARSCPGSGCAGARGFDARCEEGEKEPGTSASRSTSAGASTRASAAGEADPLAPGQDGLAGSPCSTPGGSEASSRPKWAPPEFAYPAPAFSVRNTFIDTTDGRLSSMVDDALAERRVRSCPSSGLGLPSAWVALSEVAARLEAGDEEEFVPTPAVSSQRAAEDEDGVVPAPAAFCSRAEDEDWDSFVPSPLPRWACVDTLEEPAPGCLVQPQAVWEERWAPLSFMPPPPLAPPPAALGEGEARMPPPPPGPPATADAAPASAVPAHPLLGSPECPTIGSALHCQGACRPCAHAFTKGCATGIGCQFCHLCGPGELKRRQRERRVQLARQKPSEPRAEVGGSARGRRGGKRA